MRKKEGKSPLSDSGASGTSAPFKIAPSSHKNTKPPIKVATAPVKERVSSTSFSSRGASSLVSDYSSYSSEIENEDVSIVALFLDTVSAAVALAFTILIFLKL